MEDFTFSSKYSTYNNCYFKSDRYINGNIRLQIISATEGVVTTVTTNTDRSVPEDMIQVKNYSENEGILDWLLENDIISEIAYFIPSGYIEIPVCQLTDKGLEIISKG